MVDTGCRRKRYQKLWSDKKRPDRQSWTDPLVITPVSQALGSINKHSSQGNYPKREVWCERLQMSNIKDKSKRCSEVVLNCWQEIKDSVRSVVEGGWKLVMGACDGLVMAVSTRVKVKKTLSLSYGFNQTSDEGLGCVYNPCPYCHVWGPALWILASGTSAVSLLVQMVLSTVPWALTVVS